MQIIYDQLGLAPFHGGVCVPTMGALHAGHVALIEHAVSWRENENAGPVVVTIFVNPTQFGPNEDFSKYPNTLDADRAKCEEAGADAVFAPSVEVMYPNGPEGGFHPALPEVATLPGLEDRCRPVHLAGVCQVVYRLLELTRPRVALFGEKDYQQLLTLQALGKQERETLGEIEIIGRPTVREEDGLALSSRNVYLSPVQRKRALGLNKALHATKEAGTPEGAERKMRSILLAHQIETEYAVVRDAETLRPIDSFDPARSSRALIAGRVGNTRLIDNMMIR